MKSAHLLIVDDEPSLRRVTQVQLELAGYRVSVAASGEEAQALLDAEPVHLVVTDLRMAGLSGIDLLKYVVERFPDLPVIVITAFATVENAVEAMKLGAHDFVTKPVNLEQLKLSVARALEHSALRREVAELRRTVDAKFGFENIIGHSGSLLRLIDVAGRAAQSDSTVLIHGETGTGKELLARALHQNSRRRQGAFITINCGAIPRDLIESELFGHTRGSFTGAVSNQVGRVELAERGTLFLDEIGELPAEVQVKLLRLLQEREIEKIGSGKAQKVDVRVVAATHRNLKEMVKEGTFREDLYYRLAVIPLELPPLRERTEDIPALVEYFMKRARERHGRPQLVLPPALMPYFTGYRWPGNIRELENVIERIAVLARDEKIAVTDLPESLAATRNTLEELQLSMPPEGISLEAVEKELIIRALQKFSGNQSQAARYLDISRKTLIYRVDKYGLGKESVTPKERPAHP